MANEDLLQAVGTKVDELKTDATNGVRSLQQTASVLEAHASTLKAHLSSLMGREQATIEEDIGFIRVHWPWLAVALIVGILAGMFVRF